MSPTMNSEVWDRRYTQREFVWSSEPNRFLVAEVASLPPGRALDVATGEGRNAVWLAERGWRLTGVDFSNTGLGKARRLAKSRGVQAQWVAADLLDYVPDPGAFDLVLIFYLQVESAQRRGIVRRATKAVAPGGLFLLVGHDSSNLEHGHGGPQDPAVLYTADDVAGDLEGTGLRIERAETVTRTVKTPDGERVALDALLRASRPGRADGG